MKPVIMISAAAVLALSTACSNNVKESQPAETASSEAPAEQQGSPDSTALKFMNAFVKFDYKIPLEEWLKKSDYVTDNYITEYKKAAKKQGSLILVTGTENSCDAGYRIEKGYEEKSGIVCVIGGTSEMGCDEEVNLKMVKVDGKWRIDGSGLVNLSVDQRP